MSSHCATKPRILTRYVGSSSSRRRVCMTTQSVGNGDTCPTVRLGWSTLSTWTTIGPKPFSTRSDFSGWWGFSVTAAAMATTLTAASLACTIDDHDCDDKNDQTASTFSRGNMHDFLARMLSQMSVNITKCSGVLGVVGSNGSSSRDFLLHGLRILEHRGYDGVGLATVDDHGKIVISKGVVADSDKHVSANDDPMFHLVNRHFGSSHDVSIGSNEYEAPATGIAHTRWATCGNKANESNVHPHVDSSGRIALIHNGTLTNAQVLRKELQEAGHTFDGQSDSEVIAKLIGHYYYNGIAASPDEAVSAIINSPGEQREAKSSLKEATRQALERCDGTWGLCILCADAPDELVVACHGSSLYIGLGDDRMYVASEISAFSKYTKNFISMRDGEIGVLEADGKTLDLSRKEVEVPTGLSDGEVLLLPEGYDHWTIKEIMDQPEAVALAMGFGARLTWDRVLLGGLDKHADELSNLEHVFIAGCGSSLNAAKYGEKMMKHLMSLPGRVTALDTAEADYVALAGSGKYYGTGLIAVTQSGQSVETIDIVDTANYEGLVSIGVVNVVGSLVARETKMGVYCNAGPENGVTSTKSFTSQVTCLALIALWFRELQDRLLGKSGSPNLEIERVKEALLRLPISLGMALKTRDQCKEVARKLKGKEHCFVLGKGFGESIAYEGALKIKEMSYLHAEGFSGGALKHGPFALIESDESGKYGATPIIMLILDDQHAQHMRTAAEEVKARGANLIIITDKPELARDLDDSPIVVPTNGPMTALGALMPLQLIAYELAVLRHSSESCKILPLEKNLNLRGLLRNATLLGESPDGHMEDTIACWPPISLQTLKLDISLEGRLSMNSINFGFELSNT